jgi:hypothetical protein
MNSTPHAMNGATDERRILQIITGILTISQNCSSLIDVLYGVLYNETMEENSVISLIAMETAEPKHKLNRSAGAIYVMLLALILGAISLTNLLESRWQVPRNLAQPALYAALAICGWLIYRRNYISYRYTLTDRVFAIEQIAGNRERTILAAPLSEIRGIYEFNGAAANRPKTINASVLPRRKSVFVEWRENGTGIAFKISPSESFLQKLTAQWRLFHAQKEL